MLLNYLLDFFLQYIGHNVFRLRLYNIVTHNQYRIIPTIFTILSTLTLVVPVSS